MKVDINMGAEIEIKKSAEELCNVFGILEDVKNERHLLNILYLAQSYEMMGEIYSDFIFSDIGPFSPQIDFDIELLKMIEVLEETEDPHNTIYLTEKGKKKCKLSMDKTYKPESIKSLKKINVNELVDLNRYIHLKQKYHLKETEFNDLKEVYGYKDEEIEKIKINIQLIKEIS